MHYFILIFLSVASLAYAETNNENRIWFGLFGKKNITSHYDLWAETQLRHDETNQTMNQTLNRFGVLRSLNSNHEVGFLFAFVQTGLTKEYRPTLQYVYRRSWETGGVSIRNRLEGRDLEDVEANSLRFRTQLRYSHSLSPIIDFVFWEEPFVNLTRETWTGDRFLERNRVFLGTRVKWLQLNLELGYMNQYVPRETKDLSEHVLVTYLFF